MGKPNFITKSIEKNKLFDLWLNRIEQIEKLMKNGEDEIIAFIVFPLLDSISFNLFRKDSHAYLQKLGLTGPEASVLFDVFRNGLIHNSGYYDLEYANGKVSWGVSSSSVITPYDTGYEDSKNPDYNIPPEKVFEYKKLDNGSAMATLYLDSLIALIRHDLQKRKENCIGENIDFIVGKKLAGNKP